MLKMVYSLINCRDGNEAIYDTSVEIIRSNESLYFKFHCKSSSCYCPFHNYNDIHSSGDICELLIGSDPNRKKYYEIEISPENVLMIGLIENCGEDKNGPVLKIEFIDECFIKSRVTPIESGFIAELWFDERYICTGDDEIYFNAYRIETDGGESEKHLFALNPTMRGKFHTPEYFVYLKDYIGD